MSTDGQGTKRHRKIAENYNCVSRVHERYRRQTDGRAAANSKREREFTFAKNHGAELGAGGSWSGNGAVSRHWPLKFRSNMMLAYSNFVSLFYQLHWILDSVCGSPG